MMNKQRKTLVLLIISLIIIGCTNSNDNINECNLNPDSELIKNKLVSAYNKSCKDCLKDILDNWKNEFEPSTVIPDSLQDIYDVYKEMYSPWALERISNSEWGNDIYKDISYYIIQDSINYDDKFREQSNNEFNTITEFRPKINNDTINTLYLNEDYEDAINCFLGTYEFIAHTQEEKQLRYEFLNNYLQFFHGHWGNHWYLETHPEIYKMSFNKSKDSVQVFFRIGYEGGEVFLGKNDTKWEIKDWKMTWIE
ncbi:hypothetical protein [Thalassobellus citreus]|uniref:hypothetical protein n=1 Tax=Thalassobellus citreus TaxID=3367752 RepID=UPI003791C6DA